MTVEADENTVAGVDLDVLDEVQRRVLWLAVRIVDAANRDRETGDGVKVGGHQASSASLVTAMTALWFAYLRAEDRVSVKPHASPVFHAIKYLLGDLDRSYLTELRARGGLQSYPSRTKDPDDVDFSTGSVGLGAAAPLFAAAVRRYVDAHWGAPEQESSRRQPRFIALLGDAELDEGNVWEAIADPATQGLGNVMWLVDFNRQSLDRVVPGVRIAQWRGQFEAAGWHVVEVKYGRRLREAPAAVRGWIDLMSNEQYQALFGLTGPKLRRDVPGRRVRRGRRRRGRPARRRAVAAGQGPRRARPGGHAGGVRAVRRRHRPAERGLRLHGQGLRAADRRQPAQPLRAADRRPDRGAPRRDGARPVTGTGSTRPLRRASCAISGARRCAARPRPPRSTSRSPTATGVRTARPVSTQDAFGKILVDLSRDEKLAPYLVTTAPDVATSTNLAGFINRMGVFSPAEQRAWSADPLLKWTESPKGQHIELGISEMNLFLLLGQLGLSGELHGRPLLPVGTVYDPFVCRGLDAFIYGVYSGSRFVVAGTPSGVTLAPEGGAHQSTVTASIGLELPNVTYIEPAYATALDWLLCDALGRIATGPASAAPTAVPAENGAYYFRLTTRPVDQAPFEEARARLGDAVLRRQVLAGAYLLRESEVEGPAVYLAGTGAVLPETLAAARELEEEGIAANVVDVTSPDRLYSAWRRTLRQGVRTATTPSQAGALRAAFPGRAPVVTVHDAASHAMAWLGSALGMPSVPLGVDEFGQSGSIPELYELHDLLPGSIVNAALAALSLT